MISRASDYLRALRPGLPRDVYLLQAGLVINAFGNGAVIPYLWLYLHNVRHLPLAIVGLAGSIGAGSALVAAALAGAVADRRGVRGTMIGGLCLSTVAWAQYPFVREPWHAFVLATLAGAGIGVWLTLQSTALALIVPKHLRHAAFAQQRVAANLGLGLGGFAGGLIVTTSSSRTFTLLFLLNAATFLVYSAFIIRLRLPVRPPSADGSAGYREVIRDRPFFRLLLLNYAYVFTSIALLASAFPVFAKNQVGIGEDSIGLLFLLNSLLIVGAQLPVAKAIEGHRRARGLALMCLFFAAAWLLVEGAGVASAAAIALALLVIGVALVSLGECLYDSIYGPLVADLAPEGRTGRYMAASGLAWQLGFITAPAASGAILGFSPFALFPLMAAGALIAAACSLRLESVLASDVIRTPRRSLARTPAGAAL